MLIVQLTTCPRLNTTRYSARSRPSGRNSKTIAVDADSLTSISWGGGVSQPSRSLARTR